MRDNDEWALVQRVVCGDQVAYRLLVQQHQRALASYARRMLGEHSAADDVVQETFLRLWTRADRFDGTSARLGTWLHNIAHNLCIDSFRKGSRTTYTDLADDTASDLAGPESCRQAEERSDRLQQAIAGLPERQRSALLMCHYKGLSNRDSASILEMSVDALESLLARARRRLKDELLTAESYVETNASGCRQRRCVALDTESVGRNSPGLSG